jgi:hypothetical protein
MYPVIAALALAQHSGDAPHDATSTLLASSCWLLVSTPPTLVSATSISGPILSPAEGALLAETACQLATQHRLAATVQVAGNRLRATFARLESELETANDGG